MNKSEDGRSATYNESEKTVALTYTYNGEEQKVDFSSIKSNPEGGKLKFKNSNSSNDDGISEFTFTSVSEGNNAKFIATLDESDNYSSDQLTITLTVNKGERSKDFKPEKSEISAVMDFGKTLAMVQQEHGTELSGWEFVEGSSLLKLGSQTVNVQYPEDANWKACVREITVIGERRVISLSITNGAEQDITNSNRDLANVLIEIQLQNGGSAWTIEYADSSIKVYAEEGKTNLLFTLTKALRTGLTDEQWSIGSTYAIVYTFTMPQNNYCTFDADHTTSAEGNYESENIDSVTWFKLKSVYLGTGSSGSELFTIEDALNQYFGESATIKLSSGTTSFMSNETKAVLEKASKNPYLISNADSDNYYKIGRGVKVLVPLSANDEGGRNLIESDAEGTSLYATLLVPQGVELDSYGEILINATLVYNAQPYASFTS